MPGDFSAAAPFIVAATLLPGSELILQGVGVNPSRTGLLDALERMGARVSVFNRRTQSGEPVADLGVTHAELVATEIVPAEVPRMIDELPLFALAASMARGASRVRGAAELRAKESDRIDSVATALRAVGARVRPTADGFTVRGVPARPRGGEVDAAGDHRVAIVGAVSGLVSQEGVRVRARTRRRYRSPASTSFSTHSPADDHRHRRARRGGQEHGRTPPRGAARRPLPRHGRDVPGGHLACAARGHLPRGRRAPRGARGCTSGGARHGGSRRDCGRGRDGPPSARHVSTARFPSSRSIRRCAR